MSKVAHFPDQKRINTEREWMPPSRPIDQANQKFKAEDQHALKQIQQWIHIHSGIHYTERKQQLLYKRLQSLCLQKGIVSLQALAEGVLNNSIPGIRKDVAHTASTNHTYFFREPTVLDFFRKEIIPALPRGERWRIWSAAASSGEESYTLAMILAETLGGVDQARSQAAILGTDLSENVIQQAEHGVYHQRRMEGIDAQLQRRYFTQVGLGNWRIDPEIKKMAIFRRLNLKSRPWPFSRHFDVVLCRNVLYYFDEPHQRDVLNSIYQVTRPGGWLLTSVTESIRELDTAWQMVDIGIYRKEG
ncbi:MAG: protein-glutamate O-methyltransferase CheR [Gammaproteobacteria bacterium]|jgi:chemotaxis protein methyltransferase CheR|nr:protein-glutamate O-methyltransferase CheR [Gammaproteobacteria bacterium]MBT4607631.1 protein-glutamate O-methyltransferase CheR [Thiotrichales bacterium]MBT3473753.1 protein-glutamate O-methyltransferase CheR [Gammaproteobacteria bacterium]MBT3967695.1 protein-glutamate O-methyltransferase CheR [Gammaproteobacteria bacterium]MBT4079849.1 protein-glutamate O-methyltransferase CheR [Gammaproteobacteria bacterium]